MKRKLLYEELNAKQEKIPSCLKPLLQGEAKCKAIAIWKCFFDRDFLLKVRVVGSRKWPISPSLRSRPNLNKEIFTKGKLGPADC